MLSLIVDFTKMSEFALFDNGNNAGFRKSSKPITFTKVMSGWISKTLPFFFFFNIQFKLYMLALLYACSPQDFI